VILPQTVLGKGAKKVVTTTGDTAKVKFAFSSSTAGAQFECSIGKRVKPKGKKARFVGKGFTGCKSPKSYTLQAGRYRFQVRAVSGALRDSSPALYNFQVIHVARK
jgi:predicted phage tail protein